DSSTFKLAAGVQKSPGKKRCHSPSPEFISDAENLQPTIPGTPPAKQRTKMFDEPSPTARWLEEALRSQRLPSIKEVQKLCMYCSVPLLPDRLKLFSLSQVNTGRKVIHVTIYPVKHCSYHEILGLHCDDKWCLGEAQEGTLRLDFSLDKQKKGGFKLATFGTMTTVPDIFGVPDICAKQTFYTKSREGQSGRTLTQDIPHDGRRQAQNLTMEIACLVRACVLLNIVYCFIEKDIALHGPPPFSIPDMHFVEAALAIEDLTAGDGKEVRAFLLEGSN
ncbi:hypothetical protein C0993_011013, partial [Termitomyces sp. T159_Od127]